MVVLIVAHLIQKSRKLLYFEELLLNIGGQLDYSTRGTVLNRLTHANMT